MFDGNGAIDVARGERAVIAVPELPREAARRSADARVEEAEGLAGAIGIDVVAARPLRVRTVRPATLLGKGQVEEIADVAKEQEAKLLIVDAALTPIQQKNLEDEVGTAASELDHAADTRSPSAMPTHAVSTDTAPMRPSEKP